MKNLLLIALLISSNALGKASKRYEPIATPTPIVAASPVGTPIPGCHVITLKCDSTCTSAERAELPSIEAAMNKTLCSSCFKQFIFEPTRRFDYVYNWSRQKIYDKLTTPTTLTLNYYYTSPKVYGYESASDLSTIHFNRNATKNLTLCQKASLGAHEFSHTQDFYHNGNRPGPNFYSGPYQVNHAFEGGDGNVACCVDGK